MSSLPPCPSHLRVRPPAPGTAAPLRLVCAWCQGLIRPGVEPVSHGICAACSTIMSAEAAKIAERINPRPRS